MAKRKPSTTTASKKAAATPEATPATGAIANDPQAGAGEAIQVTAPDTDPLPPVATVQTLTGDDGTTRETVIAAEGETLSDAEKESAVDGEWMAEKIGPYLEAYPEEKAFHITSDGQVFFGKDKAFAKEHQHKLNDGGCVHSFTVEKP